MIQAVVAQAIQCGSMPRAAFNLAIETSGRVGSVTLGRGDELLDSLDMESQKRHTVDLMPTIDRLCQKHGVAPRGLGEIYISLGPGSFTGLRIGVATVKMLAQVLGAKLVGVPTLEVLAQNVPASSDALAVGLNLKGDTIYTAIFHWTGELWNREGEPALLTVPALLERAPRPLMLLGDPLPLPEKLDAGVRVLPVELATARSEHVWRLGRRMAGLGEFTDPHALLPLYVRPPEAVELWKKRLKK